MEQKQEIVSADEAVASERASFQASEPAQPKEGPSTPASSQPTSMTSSLERLVEQKLEIVSADENVLRGVCFHDPHLR